MRNILYSVVINGVPYDIFSLLEDFTKATPFPFTCSRWWLIPCLQWSTRLFSVNDSMWWTLIFTPFLCHDSLLFFHASEEDALLLKHYLDFYCASSGQCINFGKSGLIFNRLVVGSLRDFVSSIMHVPILSEVEHSLGIPSQWLGLLKK